MVYKFLFVRHQIVKFDNETSDNFEKLFEF